MRASLQAWLLKLEQRHPRSIDLGLERCGAVYRQMGSPRPAQRIFTVAGTNGKGSTVAYLAAMSGALGQRYGTYTSPHIFRFNERISIMGSEVSDACLVQAFEDVERARMSTPDGEISLTYFEFTTLAAFLILEQARLDCAVLEVGLGGRLDAVNLVDADCTVITPIGLDHQDYLGPDIASIAAEKAGIIRAGIPVVCTMEQPPEAVLNRATRLDAPIYRRGTEYALEACSSDESSSGSIPSSPMAKFGMGAGSMYVATPPMGGKHQLDNLAAALAALVLLNPDCIHRPDEISSAIKHCRLPGRLQTIQGTPEILLDVGHNEMAARVVAAYLQSSDKTPVTCVLAMLKDKPAELVALSLDSVTSCFFCAGIGGDRGQDGETLARRVQRCLPDKEVRSFGTVAEAVSAALTKATAEKTVLVFGSFLAVCDATRWIEKRMQRDARDAAKIPPGDGKHP